MTDHKPEVWLQGPIEQIPPLLQPVAHSLRQVAEEVEWILAGFPEEYLWTRPNGVASVGFHLQHIRGVIDRLFTYARGKSLDDRQRESLAAEGKPGADGADVMIRSLQAQVETALTQLRATDESELTAHREVGRARLPSTVLGLLVHAAEHSQRHLGQLLVTARVQRPSESS